VILNDPQRSQVNRSLALQNLPQAFLEIERSYISEIEEFTGEKLNTAGISLNQVQVELELISGKTRSITALIYPIMLGDRLEMLVIPPKSKGTPFLRTNYNAPADTIKPVIASLRTNLLDPSSQDYLPEAQQMHKWIMAPIEAELKKREIETIVFVMDGDLRVLPIAVLHDGKQFLTEKYAIATIPSLLATRLQDRDRTNTRILGMAVSEAVQGFSALPLVETEVRSITNNNQLGNILLNEPVTIANLQSQRQAQKFGIIHLATHAQFQSDKAGGSFVQMWNERLTIPQIRTLRLDSPQVELLTLSACQTALGKNLGLSGLAVQLGVKSVLASLWSVSDAGTAPFMIEFYNDFSQARNKAIALQSAQRSMIQGKVRIVGKQILGLSDGNGSLSIPGSAANIDLTHPYYWSPFILVGNWL